MPHFSYDFETDFVLKIKNFCESLATRTKYGTTATVAATSIIISSIGLLLIYVYSRKNKEKNIRRIFTRSLCIGTLHGGKQAMERLLHYHKMRANEKLQNEVLEKLEERIQNASPDFPKLQSIVAKLEMSGQEDRAIEILKEAAGKAKAKSLSHHEYEYQMLLVEMLIYKGNYAEVENASCLNCEEVSDVRRPLYKAIIQHLLDNHEKAKQKWEEFVDMGSQYLLPPDVKEAQYYKLLTSFEIFKQVVDLLKEGINERKKAK